MAEENEEYEECKSGIEHALNVGAVPGRRRKRLVEHDHLVGNLI